MPTMPIHPKSSSVGHVSTFQAGVTVFQRSGASAPTGQQSTAGAQHSVARRPVVWAQETPAETHPPPEAHGLSMLS